QGGDRVSAGNSWVQYAGVMNQYFASVLVIDSAQAPGDWNRPRQLDSVRPTLETTEVKAVLVDPGTVNDVDGTRMAVFRVETGPMLTRLLPRVIEHLDQLGLKSNEPCVLSYYRAPGTNQPVATWVRRGHTPKPFFDDITVRLQSEELKLEPGAVVTHKF